MNLRYSKPATLMITIFLASHVYAASFDCGKAKSKVEKAICSDNELGALDSQMAVAYKNALTTHPLPEYMRARQRDWLALNSGCDPKNFVACLRKGYIERINQLKISKDAQLYSSAKPFDYSGGDAVAEIATVAGKTKISVWGGFVTHRQLSEEQGKPVYVGCEFEGELKNGAAISSAISDDGTELRFRINGKVLEFGDDVDEKICAGFGSMPRELTRVR